MNSKIAFNSLHIKVTLSVATATLLVMLLSGHFFYNNTYEKSYLESERSVSQLMATVETTAAISAYVGNKELASQVISGLLKNDNVVGAKIVANGKLLGEGGSPVVLISKPISLVLKAPFNPTEITGQLVVTPNIPLIEKHASEAAMANTINLAGQALVILLAVMLLVYRLMTSPLTRLSQTLHKITPGEAKTLDIPEAKRKDEIGQLVRDINGLLLTVDHVLTEERQLRHRIEALEHRFRGIFEDSSAGIFLIREDGSLVTANQAFCNLMNIHASDPQTVEFNVFNAGFGEPNQVKGLIKLAIVAQRSCSADLITHETNNLVKWVHCIFSPAGENQGQKVVEGVMYDVTQRKFTEERTKELAEKDILTGLANRQAADTFLRETVLRAKRESISFIVLLCDLDRFKYINDTYGHDAGDWVLKVVADRLRRRVRSSDLVARLGGDEFFIVLSNTDNLQKATEIAQAILLDHQESMEVQPGFTEQVGISIGIAAFNPLEDNEASVRKHADKAMYTVKRRGKNGYAIYDLDNLADLPLAK